MKNLLFLFVLVLGTFFAEAQEKSNLTFFTENNETFTVFLNGVEQNQSPLTNVKLKGLPESDYYVKIVFTDVNNNDINKTLHVEAGTDASFIIKTRNDGGKVLALLGEEPESYKRERYTQSDYFINEDEVVYDVYDRASENVNVNVNVNESGVNVNVDIQDNNNYNEYDEYGNPIERKHYIMPGYSGEIGCPWPMKPNNFLRAKHSINSADFENDKLMTAKQISRSNCLTSKQVKQIMELFDFEDSKLKFAKFAYRGIYDIENYFIINDSFDFASSKRELNNYINLNRY